MKLHVDEDMASPHLVRLLQKANHDVTTPSEFGILGRSDVVQLTCAIREGRVCLTANYEDFEELHFLVRQAQGTHSGILVVRKVNDPTRDLSRKGIVNAIRKLESAGVPIQDEYIVLNHWR